MKPIKVIFWIFLFALFGLVVYQNQGFFLSKQSLDIDLGVMQYHTPELPIALMALFMFLLGGLLAYLSGLADRFRLANHNTRLQQAFNSQQAAIDVMKRDVASLKPKREMPQENPPAIESSTGVQTQDQPQGQPLTPEAP
jgi:hypothetical protein